MRVTQFKKASLPAKLFVSAKSSVAIPITNTTARDALIQASLDPAVSKIDYLSWANVSGENVRLDAIVLHRDGRKYCLEILEARPLRDLDEEGLVLVAFANLGISSIEKSAEEILQEPRCSNAREIWQNCNTRVSFHDQADVVTALEAHGALTIRELGKIVDVSRPLTTVIYALACEGVIEIDISERKLSGHTMIRKSFRKQQRSGNTLVDVCPPMSWRTA
jgi:hypothetical protein